MDRRQFVTRSVALAALAAARPVGLAGMLRPGSLTVAVDPRVELYYVILQLSGFEGPEGAPAPVMTRLRFPYRDAVEDRFGPFREHPAITRYAAMARSGFWMGHPVRTMLHLGDPPALDERIPVDPFTVDRAGGRAALDAFLADARRFARDSDFSAWFAARSADRAAMEAACRERLDRDYVGDLTAYCGERRDAYSLILAPLAHPGGFGPRVRQRDGRYAAFAVIGPKSVDAGRPTFGTAEQLRRVLWHEFAHAHVNHLTDRYLERLMGPVTELQGHVRAQVERHVPWDIHVADWVSEHVVRGITTRLAHRELGPGPGADALSREERRFAHVGRIAERLQSYEQHRGRFPTLADFYPELVRVFEEVAAA